MSTTSTPEICKKSQILSGAGPQAQKVKKNFTTWGEHGKIHEKPRKPAKTSINFLKREEQKKLDTAAIRRYNSAHFFVHKVYHIIHKVYEPGQKTS